VAKTIQIKIQAQADLKALKEVQAALGALGKTSGKGGSAGLVQQTQAAAKLAVANDKAAISNQRLAAAAAQANAAQGRAAAATSQAAAAQSRAALAALRLEQAQTRAAAATARASSGMAVLPRTIAGLSHEAAAFATSMLGVGTAMAAIGTGVELAQLGAQAALVEERFNGLAEAAGTTGDALMGALRAASGGEISDMNLQLAANRAQLLGVADSAEEMGVLMQIARDRAQAMGISTTQAFNDLVTGLGRGSALILDNLGIMVEVGEVNEAYAASVGKSVTALTEAEKKQALINAVISQGKDTIAATGGAVESTAGTFQALQANADNAKAAVGRVIGELLKVPAQVTTEILVKVTRNAELAAKAPGENRADIADAARTAKDYDQYRASIDKVNEGLRAQAQSARVAFAGVEPLTEAQFRYVKAQEAAKVPTEKAIANVQKLAGAFDIAAQVQDKTGNQELADDMVRIAALSPEAAHGVETLGRAFVAGQLSGEGFSGALRGLEGDQQAEAAAAALVTQRHGEQTAGTLQVADASIAAAQASRDAAAGSVEQAAASELAALQANAMTSALDQSVNAGLSAEAAAMRLAAQFGVSESAAIAAANAYYAARDAAAAFALVAGGLATFSGAAGLANQRSGERGGSGSAATDAARTRAQMAANEAARRAASATGGRAGGGGGGGARVSDEQKAGEQIASIAEKTAQRLIEIDQRAAEARAAAYRSLAAEILASSAAMVAQQEADDLDLVGASEEEAQRLMAREQAQAKARVAMSEAVAEARARAESDPALAEDVLKARQEQISAQQDLDQRYAERQAELAENPEALAALKTQYDEATAAISDQTAIQVELAEKKAADAAAAAVAEKDAVIKEAQAQASGVKGATDAQISAFNSWASGARAAADRVIAAMQDAGRAVASVPSPSGGSSGGGGGASAPSTGGGGGGGVSAKSGGGAVVAGGMVAMGALTPMAGQPDVEEAARRAQEILKPKPGASAPPAPAAPKGKGKGKAKGKGKGKAKGPSQADTDKELEATEKAIALLNAIAELRALLAEGAAPIDGKALERLAAEAKMALGATLARLIPLTEDQAEAAERYMDAASNAIGILSDVLSLRSELAEAHGPIDGRVLERLAEEARQALGALLARLLPATESLADRVGAYADAVGSAVSALVDTLKLRKELSDPALYQPIDPKLVDMLVRDADVVIAAMNKAAARYETKGLEAAQTFADALSSTYGAFHDALVFNQALTDSAFAFDPKAFAQFEKGVMATLDGTERLAARAAAIPEAHIARLDAVMATVGSTSEALIKLAAVPWADIPKAAGAFGGLGIGGGIGGTTINNTFHISGSDPNAIADTVVRRISSQIAGRRA